MKHNISLLKVKHSRELEKILENSEKNYNDSTVNN